MAAYESWKVYIAFASDPESTSPTWTEVTAWVRGRVLISSGRQDEHSTTQPGTCSFALDNKDHRFTPGNTSSPHAPNVRKGKRVKVTDTVGPTTYDLYTGWITGLDPGVWADTGFDQAVQVVCTDRLGRLGKAKKWPSFLVAHNTFWGADSLVAYYPLGEGSDATQADNYSRYAQPSTTTERYNAAVGIGGSGGERVRGIVEFGSAQPADRFADTLTGPTFSIDTNPAETLMWGGPYLQADGITDNAGASLAFSVGQIGVVAAWVTPSAENEITGGVRLTDGTSIVEFYIDSDTAGAGIFKVNISGPSWTASAVTTNRAVHWGRPYLIALRFTYGSGATLWVDQNEHTIITSGAGSGTMTLSKLQIGYGGYAGSISHVQVYKDTASMSYDLTDQTRQHVAGWEGLDGDLTAARVSTLATYAGIDSSEISVQAGGSRMTRVDLNDKTPLDGMRVAEETENGLLFCAGDGKLTFHVRDHRYNPSLAATFLKAELAAELELRHGETVINDMTAKRSGGTAARSVDLASVTAYGTEEGSVDLAVASDGDVRPAARWRTRNYATPRDTCPAVTFELLTNTDDLRHRVLGRTLGDRIATSGMPATFPPGAAALHIEGRRHEISTAGHVVTFTTSPVLGAVPGVPDTWWEVGTSNVGTTNLVAY